MSRVPFSALPARLVLIAALGCGGCASTYKVTVDASARAEAAPPGATSFHLRHANAATLGALRRSEIESYLRAALSAQGLYEAAPPQAADLIVEVSYGIEPPRVEVVGTQELIYGRPAAVSEHLGRPPEGVMREMMGYSSEVLTTVVREKYMSICARTNQARADDTPPADLWRVHVRIDSESEDLRGHLPVLISAAMDRMGRNTDGEAEITLQRDDEAIRFVRKGF